MSISAPESLRRGFCLYIDTLCDGAVPAERDAANNPIVYPTREAAQREIADLMITRLQEYLDGARDFEDAIVVEDYIAEIEVLPDGSIGLAGGAGLGA